MKDSPLLKRAKRETKATLKTWKELDKKGLVMKDPTRGLKMKQPKLPKCNYKKKFCISCRKTRSIKNYYKDLTRTDGYSPYCKHCRSKYGKEYRKREYAKIAKRESSKNSTFSLRRKIFDKYSAICKRCGFDDPRALQIDHVNGGGAKERKTLHSTSYLKKVLNDNTNSYQILCANCNFIKRAENKEYAARIFIKADKFSTTL